MKKLSLLVAASMLVAGAWALPSYVEFSSTGPDKYADGKDVLPGEVYALVWVAEGATFEGFAADGSVKNPETSKLIGAAAIATANEKGEMHCPTVFFMLNGKNADLPAGTFSVYLLDTRIVNDEGKTVLGELGSTMTFKAVNSYTATVTKPTEAGGTLAAGSVTEGAVASEIPAAIAGNPNPAIKEIKINDDKVTVRIGNTFPCFRYSVSAGPTIGEMGANGLLEGFNGKSGEFTMELNRFEQKDDKVIENRFFKIKRKEIQ